MFSKWSTSAIGKSWLKCNSDRKLSPLLSKFVKKLIYFKLIISNFIKQNNSFNIKVRYHRLTEHYLMEFRSLIWSIIRSFLDF